MSERETAEAIEAEAAAWVARLDRDGGDDAAAAAAAWAAGDPRRQGALFRARVAWRMLDRASALRGGGQAEPAGGTAEARWSRRRMLWGSLAAAGVAGTAGLGWLVSRRPGEEIRTAVGEIRRMPLQDGSLVTVNTATRLAVDLGQDLRRIDMAEGEAWFRVAHDRRRPFVVAAGEVRVQAVGTAFSVRRTPAGADVQVTEGVVEVWSVGRPDARRRVAAGSRVAVSDAAGPQAVVEAGAEIDRSLSWRSGQLVFDGDMLGEAASEFNRYNRLQVRIDDPSLASERFVGRFRTNEPDAFARAAATILGARAEVGADEIRLSRR